jgi:hypothetical protein
MIIARSATRYLYDDQGALIPALNVATPENGPFLYTTRALAKWREP